MLCKATFCEGLFQVPIGCPCAAKLSYQVIFVRRIALKSRSLPAFRRREVGKSESTSKIAADSRFVISACNYDWPLQPDFPPHVVEGAKICVAYKHPACEFALVELF
eukprot:s419_g33.t1